MELRRTALIFVGVLLLALAGCSSGGDTVIVNEGTPGPTGPTGPQGPPGDEPTTAVEACIGCHGATGVVPVFDVSLAGDAHHIDIDADGYGPAAASGYRELHVDIQFVDVDNDVPPASKSVKIEFTVQDENGAPVPNLVVGDGRFTIAHLLPDPGTFRPGATPFNWHSLITSVETPDAGVGTGDGSPETQADYERFSSGDFMNLTGGAYSYSSFFDPTSIPVGAGDTLRVAVQISARDLPAGNGWCDFDADLVTKNDCVTTPTDTREIVETATCNGCHGVTADTRLALHGGGRTEVEYCVTCHNPDTTDAESDNVLDFKVMIHKIHRGADLPLAGSTPYMIYGRSLHDYSHVQFTKDIDDCTNCHVGGGSEVGNWSDVPTRAACGSCHEDVNFASGAGHAGGAFLNDELCAACHPPTSPGAAPIEVKHRGVARAVEAGLYADDPDDGIKILAPVVFDPDSDELTVDFKVVKDGTPMDLANDPEWNMGSASRLVLSAGWDTADYTNEGSGSPPASVVAIDVLDELDPATVDPAVVDIGAAGDVYQATLALPSDASGTVTVFVDGHPAADLGGTDPDRIAIRNVFADVNVEARGLAEPRRLVVDVAKCNQCHDAAGRGISLHGNNRTGEPQVCAVCHNPNNTDIDKRPPDPAATIDGLREASIDFKHMIHRIHSGEELQDPVVIWGFGFPTPTEHDFSHVEFIGNRQNCDTCHVAGTYSTQAAWDALPTTIDTGADEADPDDDLNISSTAAVCSSCHDDDVATDHMKLHGASFQALDDDIL